MPELNAFDALKIVSKRDDSSNLIWSAHLATNLISFTKNKHGYIFEIGVSHAVGEKFEKGELRGALYFVDSVAYKQAEKEVSE